MSERIKIALVVEDDDDLRYVTVKQLAKLGIKSEIATNGLEAVERMKHADFCVVLMDIMMPEMDGFTAAKLIREYEHENQLTPTPIIAMTAFEQREKCLEAGMNHYMFKPVLQEALRIAVDEWLPKKCA